ncbi:hypothetical protein SETIT_9G094400v2 [Setaria italica]|uniref:Uncharacterized protein n=1 Tax=Setaria italica TaxID=4555 RepID=A0A368SER0_SETIT|nr:hypothetical protein SETIT_9G094400v2 [Setaria italica]RCV40928.1 hypothetical protein SETIT_9G094400v2 [Setaria italica]
MRHAISATTEWKNSDRTNSSPARSNPHRQAGITHQRKEKINPRPDEPPFLHTEPREEPRAGGGSIGGRVGGETTVLAAPFGWRTTGARSAADEHGAAEKVLRLKEHRDLTVDSGPRRRGRRPPGLFPTDTASLAGSCWFSPSASCRLHFLCRWASWLHFPNPI